MPIVHSASSMLCLWLEHRRCALWLGRSHDEQWQIKDSVVIASERRERGNQRAKNPQHQCLRHSHGFTARFNISTKKK
ncbi:MAG: hypothetical protein K2N70_02255 [Helicobacter sp.]|nr:hypothetical protein [Helicobacter sp.]